MLQGMADKVTAEGKKEEELYEKFMCYCKNNVGLLEQQIKEGTDKIEQYGNTMTAGLEKMKTTEASLKEHQASVADAKASIAKATALREKESSEYAKYKEDATTNIAAMGKALTAIEKGMGGAFLQTKAANVLRNYAMEKAEMADATRHEVLVFLDGSQQESYAPASGEITGIIAQMKDTMASDLADATKVEEESIKSFDSLVKSKQEEIDTVQPQVEKELKQIGDLKIMLAEMAGDFEKTKEALAADKKFLAELEKGCSTKTAEWEERCKLRQEELKALSDTIKILNDDDALELFKKTLPGASASLVQIQVTTASMRKRALAALREARHHAHGKHVPARPELDLIEMALNGKQQGFEKVIKMIDSMVS